MGVDEYPHPRFGFNNLFEPSQNPYCSDSMTGPVLVQGVYIPEDTGKFYEEDQKIRDLVDGKLKLVKSRGGDGWRLNISKDEQRAHCVAGAAAFIGRVVPDDPITQHSIESFPFFQLARYFDASTMVAKRNFPN